MDKLEEMVQQFTKAKHEEKKEQPKAEAVEQKKEVEEVKEDKIKPLINEVEENETIQDVEKLIDRGFTPDQTTEILKIKNDNLKLHHSTFSMIQDIQRGYMEVFKELIKLKEATLWKTGIKVITAMLAGAFLYDQWDNVKPLLDVGGKVLEHFPFWGDKGQ